VSDVLHAYTFINVVYNLPTGLPFGLGDDDNDGDGDDDDDDDDEIEMREFNVHSKVDRSQISLTHNK